MIRREDVTIQVSAEIDPWPVRGNASASGSLTHDIQIEDEILARLAEGDVWAWANVTVRVSFGPLSCEEYIGCCTYDNKENFIKNSGYYDDMVEAGIAKLNEQIHEILYLLENKEGSEG